jgi:hypothetical protein
VDVASLKVLCNGVHCEVGVVHAQQACQVSSCVLRVCVDPSAPGHATPNVLHHDDVHMLLDGTWDPPWVAIGRGCADRAQ